MRFSELIIKENLSQAYLDQLKKQYQGKSVNTLSSAELRQAKNVLTTLDNKSWRQIAAAGIPVIGDLARDALQDVPKMPVEKIIPDMQAIGLDNYRIDSSKKLSVYVPRAERKATIRMMLDKLDATYDVSAGSSSLGLVIYKGVKIQIRPAGGSGEESAGLKNEAHLIETINRMIGEVGPLNITFVGDNGQTITARDVTEAQSVGADTANRKKSDVNLVSNGKPVPLSLKKANAEYWESADTMWGDKADALIDQLNSQGKIKLTPVENKVRNDGTPFVKVSPEIAVKATAEETIDVVFGIDILQGNGGVVKETFEDEHYKLEGNNLTVTANLVITKPEDIPDNQKVFWLIRNDSTRTRPNHKYPGLRVLAAYAKRINPNVLVVDQ
jgi:hypothetical protein